MKHFAIVSSLVPLLAGSLGAQNTLHVPADHPTIQDAIVAAADGDRIEVDAGVYGPIDFLGKAITVEATPHGDALIQSSYTTAVVFVNGEGPDSRLIGFGISGRVGNNPSGGIYCEPYDRVATPYIADCVIGGCDASYAQAEGIGVHGNPIMERCTISGNRGELFSVKGTSFGGGIYGAPTLISCRLSGNLAATGGGLVLQDGAYLENCDIVANDAGPGFSQYGPFYSYGGGMECANNVVLVGCLIAGNSITGATDVDGFHYGFGAAIYGDPTLIGCTIVDNRLYDGAEVGGIYGGGRLTSCILRDNDGEQGGSFFEYCDAQGPPPGTGNFDADPRFVNRIGGDYRLLPDSPCIDAGDPGRAHDPDGTRADVGARWFNQHPAAAATRAGAGINPLVLASNSLPILGKPWSATLTDPSASAHVALLQGNTGAGSLVVPFGEILLDLSTPRLLRRVGALNAGSATFTIAIPH